MSGYQYLATVYSRHPFGLDVAWRQSCGYAAQFIKAGIPVFCPIAGGHPIAVAGLIDQLDHDFWMAMDRPLMDGAAGLVVVTSTGWQESLGIAFEIDHFERAGKPIAYWRPGTPPRAA